MSDTFQEFVEHCQQQVQQSLASQLGSAESEYARAGAAGQYLAQLLEAMQYCLLNGGKRVRPLLVYAAAHAVGARSDHPALAPAACAVEYIHTYSLVHDDLPAMDNDDLRRGQPTCHRAFDEATAILVGDGLQSRAFELLATVAQTSPEQALQLVRILSAAAGPRGMVGGQAIDLSAVAQNIDAAHLETMHRLKTGALIRAAVAIGAVIAGADEQQRARLDHYAEAIGLSFQVQDDILDVTGDTSTLGKQQGADSARNKPTYVTLLGLDEARSFAQQLHWEALAALSEFGPAAGHLRELSHYIVSRAH